MKKKNKIILVSVAAACLLAGIGTGVAVGVNSLDNKMSGTMVEEGSGEYDWKKYDVWINSGYTVNNKFYTNHDGDFIENVKYIQNEDSHYIRYACYFNFFDDLETVVCVYDLLSGTKIYSDVETTHQLLGGDFITIDDDNASSGSYVVSEIWVRTVD